MPGVRRAGILLALAPAGCADGCSDGGGGDDFAGSTSGVDDGGASESDTGEPIPEYELDADDEGTITIQRDGEILLVLPDDALQVGVTNAIDPGLSYDPVFDLDVVWQAPRMFERMTTSDGDLSLRLVYPGTTRAVLTMTKTAPGRWAATWVPEPGSATIAAYRLRARIDAEEGLYGLGEWFDHPNHRGRDRAMQLEGNLAFESSNNEAHVPVPLLIGTRGWGLFVEDPHAGRFECATEADDLLQVTFGLAEDGADGLRFHVFAAEHPLDITAHYHAVTGAPARPARWALGPWIWRNENDDQAQVIDDIRTLRELDLAASALWVDRPYATGVNSFDFHPPRFPDPQAMIDEAHDHGLRFALWHTPYVSDNQEPVPGLHNQAESRGYFPPDVGVVLNPWSRPIDFTNPGAYAWWQDLLDNYRALGVEGYKLDYGEDILTGFGPTRTAWEFFDGSTERTMQSRYQLLYHRVYSEMLPEDGGFILARAGTYGDQTITTVIWPGDLDANMSKFGDLEGGKFVTGGLPSAVVAGLSLGPSGYPLFASDTGGYKGSPPDKETFTRWFQHTALMPVMQIGTASSDVAWEANEENGFDQEMLGWYREFTRLHLRLFPWFWTHLERVIAGGRPIVRPLGLAWPELGEHPAYDYMLGDDLLVAPVVERGATTRDVLVPPGHWIGWFDGDELDGPAHVTVDAPLSTLPLYLRAGGLVPMLRPTIDTLAPTTMPDEIDSFAMDPGVLFVRTSPGPSSELTLYDGTFMRQGEVAGTWALAWRDGAEFDQGAVIEAMAFDTAPREVLLDDQPLAAVADPADSEQGWAWDSTVMGGLLQVRIPPGEHVLVVR